ncbi:MAG: TIM barrel protein [Candidatus Woesearchaeota archaeon]|nr:TIM barrel protein [Candidatus Woesearchaeota archaeon]
MKVKLGPGGTAGLGSIEGIKYAKDHGLTALEVEFTYGVSMTNETAKQTGALANQLNIDLSVHAPYYINLVSEEKKKIEASKKRILDSCERAHFLNAKYVVFHAAFYGKHSKEETFALVKKEIEEMQKTIRQNKWNVALAPELTGKHSAFGDPDELIKLSKETGCAFCIDFSHWKARNNGDPKYDELFKKLKGIKHIHSHFSGIDYTPKGERKHKLTEEKDIKELITYIKKYNVDITIINESPDPFGDSIKTKRILEKI